MCSGNKNKINNTKNNNLHNECNVVTHLVFIVGHHRLVLAAAVCFGPGPLALPRALLPLRRRHGALRRRPHRLLPLVGLVGRRDVLRGHRRVWSG